MMNHKLQQCLRSMLCRHIRSREQTSTHSEPGTNGDELRTSFSNQFICRKRIHSVHMLGGCTGSISALNMTARRKIFISS